MVSTMRLGLIGLPGVVIIAVRALMMSLSRLLTALLHLVPLLLLVLGQKSANLRFGSGTNVHPLGSPIFDR